MPLVDPEFVAALFERATGHDAAVPRPEGRLHPTQAVYRAGTTAAACRRALDGDRRGLVDVLSELDWVAVDPGTVDAEGRSESDSDSESESVARDTLTNVNTREAFERVADRL
jgi:molybdopterin-guanine dinucleotide biosynthesis protein A